MNVKYMVFAADLLRLVGILWFSGGIFGVIVVRFGVMFGSWAAI